MSTANKEIEFDGDVFDSMVYGTFDSETEGTDGADDTAENNEDYEDTDQDTGAEDGEDLDENRDGDTDEDSTDSDDGEEENAPVEGDDLDGDGVNAEDEADEAAQDDNTDKPEDSTETEDPSDGKGQDTGTVDYKAFYDAVVNTEFVVNGKKVKGFADPQKIIQSQQMAGGFSEKMAGFKKYRPFMSPLQERGMLEDQSKFDLAMNLIDGDKEAIKAHLNSLGIDPMDLDMDSISYTAKPAVASSASLIIEDTMDRAKSAGIEDRVRSVVGTEWDASSFQEFVSNEAVRNDLLNHIESGVYDMVTERMGELSRLDYNGNFNSMNTVNKYRAAVKSIQADDAKRPRPAAAAEKVVPVTPATTIKSEKDKITKARQEEKYKEEAAKREAAIAQQRKKASSMSKKKPMATPKVKFDPMKAEGEELDNLMDFLIAGGRA